MEIVNAFLQAENIKQYVLEFWLNVSHQLLQLNKTTFFLLCFMCCFISIVWNFNFQVYFCELANYIMCKKSVVSSYDDTRFYSFFIIHEYILVAIASQNIYYCYYSLFPFIHSLQPTHCSCWNAETLLML